MPARLVIPQTMVDFVSVFVVNEGLPLTVVARARGGDRVTHSAKRRQRTATVLQAGRWIACGMAPRMTETLGVSSGGVGKLLNHIDIRLRARQSSRFE